MIGSRRPPAAPKTPPTEQPAAVGYASAEELGVAWHELIGWQKNDANGTPVPFTPEEVAKVLKANSAFVRRVLASDEEFFFGPRKVLLDEAKRLGNKGDSDKGDDEDEGDGDKGGGEPGGGEQGDGNEGDGDEGEGDKGEDNPRGGGIKAAAAGMKRQRSKAPQGARGHAWKTDFMDDRPWLRTIPEKSRDEWDLTPTEAPHTLYCVACNFFRFGHQDVLAKKKMSTSVRRDKVQAHEQDAKHARAVQKYEERFGQLEEKPGQPQHEECLQQAVTFVEPPLANLLRTVITVALTKTAVRLVPAFVELQRANGTAILSMNSTGKTGVQTLLHAAAVVLRRRQDDQLRRGSILSTMGDGSNDSRTTEQVISY